MQQALEVLRSLKHRSAIGLEPGDGSLCLRKACGLGGQLRCHVAQFCLEFLAQGLATLLNCQQCALMPR